MNRLSFLFLVVCTILACADKGPKQKSASGIVSESPDTMIRANLYSDADKYSTIQKTFQKNNPGYHLQFQPQINELEARTSQRILFVQKGGGTAHLNDQESSKISVGDIIILDPNTTLSIDSLVDVVIFTTPESPANSIPHFVRPDWDMNITDVPGGCATETNAYRRILLTWLGHVGKYLYKSLNAHRVRITDSFTHYHPKNHGFDEFYLVQMVQPGAAIITGNRHDLIENPDQIDKAIAKNLLQKTELHVGDLIYLPRGVVHRGIGGVLAQVITVPGFIPGAEIGVDHHLKRINEKLELSDNDRLPYNALAADIVMIK